MALQVLRKSSETMVALAEDHMNDGELYVPVMSRLLAILQAVRAACLSTLYLCSVKVGASPETDHAAIKGLMLALPTAACLYG